MLIDYHIHTNYSDGDHSPKEIITLAKLFNVKIISITDHNTLEGVKEAVKINDDFVKIIPGVEISTRYKECKIHVLGYFKKEILENNHIKIILNNIRNKKSDSILESTKGITKIEFNENKKRIHPINAIEIIHYFDGEAILAHPCKIDKSVKNELLEMPFDGIEGGYFKNSIEERNSLLEYCRRNNLKFTYGSDFHTLKKNDKRHGIIGCTL